MLESIFDIIRTGNNIVFGSGKKLIVESFQPFLKTCFWFVKIQTLFIIVSDNPSKSLSNRRPRRLRKEKPPAMKQRRNNPAPAALDTCRHHTRRAGHPPASHPPSGIRRTDARQPGFCPAFFYAHFLAADPRSGGRAPQAQHPPDARESGVWKHFYHPTSVRK